MIDVHPLCAVGELTGFTMVALGLANAFRERRMRKGWITVAQVPRRRYSCFCTLADTASVLKRVADSRRGAVLLELQVGGVRVQVPAESVS